MTPLRNTHLASGAGVRSKEGAHKGGKVDMAEEAYREGSEVEKDMGRGSSMGEVGGRSKEEAYRAACIGAYTGGAYTGGAYTGAYTGACIGACMAAGI